MDRRNFPKQNEHPGSMLPYEMRSRGFCRQWAGEDAGMKESCHPGCCFLSVCEHSSSPCGGAGESRGDSEQSSGSERLRLYLDLRGEGARGGGTTGEAARWCPLTSFSAASQPSALLAVSRATPEAPTWPFNPSSLCPEPSPRQESTALLSHLLQIPGSLGALPGLKPSPPPPPALPALSPSLSFLPTYCQLLREVQSAGQEWWD